MPFTDMQRHLAVTLLALTLAACATSPDKGSAGKGGDKAGAESVSADDAAKVSEKADSALFGSWFGGDDKPSKKRDKKDKEAAEADAAPAPVGKRALSLPMVLAPGAEKDAKAAKSQYTQAMTALKAGNEDQALALLRDISNTHPNLSGPLLNQAILLRKKGRLKEAQELLKKSMTSQTQNPRVFNEMGVVSRELGNFNQAKSAYETAIRLAPGYDRAHYNLAVLADLYLNDPALAIKEFEMYQSLQDKRDKKVDGWLKELKRRAGAE